MNVQTGKHGVKLAAPGFDPSQLRGKPVKPVKPKTGDRTRPKISKAEMVRRALPENWQAVSTILRRAEVAVANRNQTLVKQLVLSGEAECRTIPYRGAYLMQYRKARKAQQEAQ